MNLYKSDTPKNVQTPVVLNHCLLYRVGWFSYFYGYYLHPDSRCVQYDLALLLCVVFFSSLLFYFQRYKNSALRINVESVFQEYWDSAKFMVLLFEDLLCVCVRFKKFYSKSTFKALLYINLQQSSYYINSNKVVLLAWEAALGQQLYQKRDFASKRISRHVAKRAGGVGEGGWGGRSPPLPDLNKSSLP